MVKRCRAMDSATMLSIVLGLQSTMTLVRE